jgi:hypothetical protein
VSTYEGTILARRTKVDLEVGDSAGEYWLDISHEEERDSGYLEYVLSAHALAHVIPADELFAEDARQRIAREVDDLRLVARLKKRTRGTNGGLPLLVVISKVDLVLPVDVLFEQSLGLFRTVRADELGRLPLMKALTRPGDAERMLSLLMEVDQQLGQLFGPVRFCFSSSTAVAENRLRSVGDGSDLVRWMLYHATAGGQQLARGRLRSFLQSGGALGTRRGGSAEPPVERPPGHQL